jgi:hypothetical protein
MAGRARLAADVSASTSACGMPSEGPTPHGAASGNGAPTAPLPIVRSDAKDHRRRLQGMRWGLVPYWVKASTAGFATINATTEGVWGFLPLPHHVMLGMRMVVPATRERPCTAQSSRCARLLGTRAVCV